MITSFATVGLAIGISQAAIGNVSFRAGADDSYTLTYDATHRVVDDTIQTSNGNVIWTKANFNASFTDRGVEFTKYGYVQNLTALSGIKSVTVNVSSGKYIVSHGYEEPRDLRTPFYYDQTITSTTTITYTGDNLPSYFRVQAVENGVATSITVNYSCVRGDGDPINETVAEGFENSKFRLSYNAGSALYVTDELCQTSFAESKRSLRISDMAKNDNVSLVDLESNRSALSLCDDDKYLIMDIKSTNAKVGSTINPFMISASLKDNSYDIGWKDPTGYVALPSNPGWYRYYWEIKSPSNATIPNTRIPFDKINGFNMIFSQDVAANEVWYVDNVHFGAKPMVERTIGNNYDMRAEDRVVLTGNEIISFDFKVTSGDTFNFGLGNWDQYLDFSLKPNGKRCDNGGNDGLYTGTYLKPLSNGWYRIYASTSLMNRTVGVWKTWNFSGNNNLKLILDRSGNNAAGYIVEPRIENDSMKYVMMPSNTYENYAAITDTSLVDTISFTYKFIDNKDSSASFMLSNNWNTFYGYFEFLANGEARWGTPYAGVTTEKLDGDVIRVTMKLDDVTKTSDEGAPTKITWFRTHSWGTGVMMVSAPVVTLK